MWAVLESLTKQKGDTGPPKAKRMKSRTKTETHTTRCLGDGAHLTLRFPIDKRDIQMQADPSWVVVVVLVAVVLLLVSSQSHDDRRRKCCDAQLNKTTGTEVPRGERLEARKRSTGDRNAERSEK